MKPVYEVRPYRAGDRARVLEFQSPLWSTDPALNDAYFRWKYEQNPYAPELTAYLVFQGQQLVGMRGFYGSRWEGGANRQKVPIWYPDDLHIAPEHRDRGLFTAIMNAAFEDLGARHTGFALSIGSRELTVLGSLTMGWKSIGPLQPVGLFSKRERRSGRWRGQLSRMRFVWRFAGAPWLNPRSRFDRLDQKAPAPSDGSVGIRLARHPDAKGMATLVEDLEYDGRIRHVRDERYFAWRFRNPLREYRFLYAGGSRLSGYLVLHRSVARELAAPVHISDWEASSESVAESLLEAALSAGQFPGVVAWGTALPRMAGPLLLATGFQPIQRKRVARGTYSTLVRPLRPGLPPPEWTLAGKPLLDPGSWDLRMLYSMVG